MKVLQLLSIGFFLLISFCVNAQTASEKKGIKLYEVYSYSNAIEKFESITEKNISVNRMLAESYLKTGNPIKAEEYYSVVVQSADNIPEDYYNYASVLLINGKYSDADVWMKKYLGLNATDSRAVDYLDEAGFYNDLQKSRNQFTIKNLDINSAQSDFGTSFWGNHVVFASSREGVVPVIRRWNWNGLPFLNLYEANRSDENELSNPTEFEPKINKKLHEGPAAFSADASLLVYTRNNYKSKGSDGVIRLELFVCDYVDGKYVNERAFPYNSPEYSVGHATLTPNGKTMYFASDMPGGFGGVDIYKSEMTADGSWSKPENLGAVVNSEGDEMFPFIHPESNILFYASDGKPGLGGLDVFVALIDADVVVEIKNLGTPINSSYDDFALILDADQQYGYFSSNRIGGKGDDDIYSFSVEKPLVFGKTIAGVVKDKSLQILPGTKVVLLYDSGSEIASTVVGDDGAYSFLVDADKKYTVMGSKDDYFNDKKIISTSGDDLEYNSDLILEKDPGFFLDGIVKDNSNSELLDGVAIILYDKVSGEEVYNSKTSNGKFMFVLASYKLNDKVSFKVKAEKDGYLASEFDFDKVIVAPGAIKMEVGLDQLSVGVDLAKIIDIKPIYFDLNKYNIRLDAAAELDKIVAVMNEYPTMVIELGSHTDSRGSDESNRILSDNRAKASAKYIVDQGIDQSRISGKGYGESKPNVISKEFHDKYPYAPEGQVLTEQFINQFYGNRTKFEELHQLNRRTEFIIVEM